jgi:hypothetical protein
VKDPKPFNKGVRFYRPKPYLRVVPHQDSRGAASDEFVDVSIEYLPDFCEEYAISICAGLGTNKTKITLKDGWNLTDLDVEIDSQFDENLKAVGDLISKLPIATAAAEERPAAVRATNVPLGYYEAVISMDDCGKKRLYGWRYVGFMPYATCPIESSGLRCENCQVDDIYGLVFDNGVMTFQLLNAIPGIQDSRKLARSAIENAALARVLDDVVKGVPEAFTRIVGIAISPNNVAATKLDDQTVQVAVALGQAEYEGFSRGAVTADDVARELAPLVHQSFNDNRLNISVLISSSD